MSDAGGCLGLLLEGLIPFGNQRPGAPGWLGIAFLLVISSVLVLTNHVVAGCCLGGFTVLVAVFRGR